MKKIFIFIVCCALSLCLLISRESLAKEFAVKIVEDTNDANIGDGQCADTNGKCSLRAAIQEANALAGDDIITLTADTSYNLSIVNNSGTNENSAVRGDLDILSSGGKITINGNNATIAGYGIDRIFDVRSGATVEFNDLTITGGVVTETTKTGGGIRNAGGTVTVKNCVIKSNEASTSGSGIALTTSSSKMLILNSLITGNKNTAKGGGISVDSGTLIIANSTISGNKANITEAGGISFTDNSQNLLKLFNVTIADNVATTGGGVYQGMNQDFLQLKHTIISGNSDSNNYPNCASNLTSLGYNIITANTGFCALSPENDSDMIGASIDPLIDSLKDNGGFSYTHALLANSPAIDIGDPAGCTYEDLDGKSVVLTSDQRGYIRPINGGCDIGAFEYDSCPIGATEVCNGKDDDCDGKIDEDYPDLNSSCTVGVGKCAGTGKKICKADFSGTTCDTSASNPGVEICNGADDDCNGSVDDGLGEISCGVGECKVTVNKCVDGKEQTCVPKQAQTEICGDGIDQDCDGSDLACQTQTGSATGQSGDSTSGTGDNSTKDAAAESGGGGCSLVIR